MDLITIDITEVPPDQIRIGDWVELFGDHIYIDALAEKAGTISWEILTRLGPRFERFYLNTQQPNEVI